MSPALLLLFFAPQDKPPEKASISGTIVSSVTGDPLNKVAVWLEPLGRGDYHTATTVTDAEGHFTLVDLDAGSYRLQGRRNGYLEAAYGARRADGTGTVIKLEAGQALKDVKFKLTPAGVIAGTVRDSDGEPLAGTRVMVGRRTYESGAPRIEVYSTDGTDDLGQYRVADLPPGRYYVGAATQGQDWRWADHSARLTKPVETSVSTFYPGLRDVAQAAPVEVTAGARVTGIDIAIMRMRAVHVSGRLADAGKLAPTCITVSLQPRGRDSDFGNSGSRTCTKNPAGDFDFAAVPPGSYVLSSGAADRHARLPIEVGDTNVEDLRVVLTPGAELRAQVSVEGSKKPNLESAYLSFTAAENNSRYFGVRLRTEPSLPPVKDPIVPPGHYRVALRDYGSLRGFFVKSIRSGETDVLNEGITIPQAASVTVEVVLASDGAHLDGSVQGKEGNLVAGATVVLVPNARSRFDLFKQAATDQYGHYVMDAHPPGEYKLFAWDEIETNAWLDPDFLKDFEKSGVKVTLQANGSETSNLHLAVKPE